MNNAAKQAFANEAEKAIKHPVVQECIDELMFNLGTRVPAGLTRYGICKVAQYAATVARAHALGIDPETLRLSAEEATDIQVRLADAALAAGLPVFVVEDPE